MIKFRCGNCSQKLGVPEKYAGRRVRCSKCQEPALVPMPAATEESTSSKPAAAPVEDASVKLQSPKKTETPKAPDMDLFADFEDSADDDEARRMEAIQMARQDRNERKAKSVKFSPKSAKIKDSNEPASGPNRSFSMMALADMVPPALGFPLSLLASFLGIAIAVSIWIFAARSTGMAMGYMALLVFAGAALGLRLFMVNSGLLLGLLGLIIALAGFGVAKYAVSKYVIKDYYTKLSNEEILVDMDKILADAADKDKGQTKSIRPYASNATYQICTAMLSMVDDDKLDPKKARGWMVHMLKGTRGPTAYDALLGSSSTMDLPELTDEDKEIFATAAMLVFEWDEEKKLLGMTKKYYPVLRELINRAEYQKILADPERAPKFCLVQAFGPLDTIWLLVGMGMCFVILTFD